MLNNKHKPTILIVNDDGISAPGIKHLVDAVKELGNVVVVAPDKPQSGMGHAITINQPLRFNKVNIFKDIESYQCNGTPADCVKIAKMCVIKHKPDICLSGINHGAHHSIHILYSGTMSAAMEGCLEDIPSIGFSFQDYRYDADFTEVKKYVNKITAKVLNTKNKKKHFLLNVNFPTLKKEEKFKGIKICQQAYALYQDKYKEGKDPNGENYFWLDGYLKNFDNNNETDFNALKSKYISIVPIQFDLTNYELKKELSQWNF